MGKDWNYAQHSREVAEHGGPEQYKADIRQGGYDERVGEEAAALIGAVGILVGAGLAWLGTKLAWPWAKRKATELQQRI